MQRKQTVAMLFEEVDRMKIFDISRDIMTTKPYGTDPVPKLKQIARLEKLLLGTENGDSGNDHETTDIG